MEYIYRYMDNEKVVYIGITNNLKTRLSGHKRDFWYKDTLKYQYIEMPNRDVARMFEKYLINRERPTGNENDNNGSDVSMITFDIEENWIEYEEESFISEVDVLFKAEKQRKVLERELQLKADRENMELKYADVLIRNKSSILKIFYDENEDLNLVYKCKELDDKFNEYSGMPMYVASHRINLNTGISNIKLSERRCLRDTYEYSRNMLNNIINELDIKSMNLDKDYGKNRLIEKQNNLEEHYKFLIETNYKIILKSSKDKNEIEASINDLFSMAGGLTDLYHLPYGYYLKFKNTPINRGVLIFFEPTEYNPQNIYFNNQFRNQFYLKNRKDDLDLIYYTVYKRNISYRRGCDYYEDNEEYSIPRWVALQVEVD